MLAAREGYCQLIELLLDRGADAKCLDGQGWTSLSWAAYAGQGRAARFLLMKVPFDLVSLVTLDGQMPSDLANSQGYHKLSQVLSKFETEFREKQGQGDAQSLEAEGPWNASQASRKYQEAYGDVALVLAAIGAEERLPLFVEHGVCFREMLNLDDEALCKMGIESKEERSKIIAGVESTRRFQIVATSPCPEAVSVVTTLRQHLGHLEVSVSHLGNHLSKKPEDLQLGRDFCSTRHLRKELREAHEALCLLSTQMQRLDQLAAKVEGCIEYEPQWPPLPVEVKRNKRLAWVPLCLLFTALWACKMAVGQLGHWPRLPGWFLHRNM
ncbi:hypothetical protein MTO96_044728 [Rhipicephalus appendiculatus]